MSDKIQKEMVKQMVEALNRMTAEAMAQGWTILAETDDRGERVFIHMDKEDLTDGPTHQRNG